MSWAFAIALTLLLAAGCFFILVGSLGLVKLSEFFKRLHAPTKASTMGVGCIVLAAIGARALAGGGLDLRELLVSAFLFISAPVGAMMMARAALAIRPKHRPRPPATPDDASRGD